MKSPPGRGRLLVGVGAQKGTDPGQRLLVACGERWMGRKEEVERLEGIGTPVA